MKPLQSTNRMGIDPEKNNEMDYPGEPLSLVFITDDPAEEYEDPKLITMQQMINYLNAQEKTPVVHALIDLVHSVIDRRCNKDSNCVSWILELETARKLIQHL